MATVPTSRAAGALPSLDQAPNRFTSSPEKYSAIADLILDSDAYGNNLGKPEVRDLLISTYGDQGITGFLKLTGAVNTAGSSDEVHWFEAGRRHKKLFARTAVTPSSGEATTTFADTSGGTAAALTQKFDVVMKVADGHKFLVTTASSNNMTLSSLENTSYNTDIVANDEFIVIGNMYPQGSQQPGSFVEPEVKRYKQSFNIVKDRFQVNGSQATNVGYINIGNGDYRWFMYGEQEARKRFEDKRELMMLLGEATAGSKAASTLGADDDMAGSQGYFSAINERGINLTGASTNPLTLSNFDDLIIELDKQGAPAEYAMYLNRKQDLAIDDMLAAGIATQVTAGLSGQFGAFQNDADLAVQLGFKSFTRGGYTFHKHDWNLLNDPTLLGAGSEFQGVMCPMTSVVDAKSGNRAPALEMMYKAANGYSREMEHWVTGGGVMGHTNGDLGEDSMTFHYRSEIALITRAANQHVLIRE
jgi:hypothetical protein